MGLLRTYRGLTPPLQPSRVTANRGGQVQQAQPTGGGQSTPSGPGVGGGTVTTTGYLQPQGGGQSTPSGPGVTPYQSYGSNDNFQGLGQMQSGMVGMQASKTGVTPGVYSDVGQIQQQQHAPVDMNDPNNAALAGYMNRSGG